MSRTARTALVAGGGLVVLLGGAWAAGWLLAGDKLPRNAEVGGVAVGGLSPAAAEQKLRAALEPLEAAKLTLTAADAHLRLTPAEAGLAVDYAASIAQAGGAHHGNPIAIYQVLVGGSPLDPVVTVDRAALDAVVATFAAEVDEAPVDATLAYAGDSPKVTPGRDGRALDRTAAAAALQAAFLHAGTATGTVGVVPPEVTTAEAQEVADGTATAAIAAAVTARVGDAGTVEISAKLIRQTLTFEAVDGELAPVLDAATLAAALGPQLDALGLKQPRDARFTIKRGGKPRIVPARDGAGVDANALGTALAGVIGEPAPRSVDVAVGARPADFTEADAEAMGVKEVTGAFTTYFPDTYYRYNNIGKAAKLINGTFLAPGETFSMNETLGERTAEAGWMAGGAIDGGRIVERLGGGISQATTTTFNAIYFAGLEDIYHKPHSLYFSRYPVGREATLDWASVDMKFRNDTDHGVLLQAWITGKPGTDGSITVRVWSTKTWKIKSTRPVLGNYRSPGKTIHSDKPGCVPQAAMSGFDVHFYRLFYRGKELVKRERFAWSYNSLTPVVCEKPKQDD
jgi:vancomycin resistance protein YoaR